MTSTPSLRFVPRGIALAVTMVLAMACPKSPGPVAQAPNAGELPNYVVDTAPVPAAAPDSSRFEGMTVPETLRKLADRMYVIGETTGKLEQWQAAVSGAATHIEQRMKDPAKRSELIGTVDELTPLGFAAQAGYAEVVDVLLRFDSVKDTIDATVSSGLSAWGLSNLAPKLSLPVINTSALNSPFALVPWLVKTPYYTHEHYAPYERTRALLERAGAKRDTAAVQRVITALPRCPDDVKKRVAASGDVLATLRDIVVNDAEYGLPALNSKSRDRKGR